MSMQTKQQTARFNQPFTLSGVEGLQPAGSYTVLIEEETIEGLSFLAFRRVETSMLIPRRPGSTRSFQSISVDPHELESSLARDRAAAEPSGSHIRSLS
jgi:hypothetical protein